MAPSTAAERKLAALAHALVLLHVPGVLVTLAIHLRARERRPFLAEHSRKALIFQVAVQGMIAAAAILVAALLAVADAMRVAPPVALGLVVTPVAGLVVYTLASAAAGAVRALAGREYRYPMPGLG